MNRVFTEQLLQDSLLSTEDLAKIIRTELCLKCSEYFIKTEYDNLIFYTCKCGQIYQIAETQ